MKRILCLFTCLSALAIGACTSDSALPNPTGKGAVRAINAIPGSPEVLFLIEERSIGGIQYTNSTNPTDGEYDDFSYDFNFEIINPGESVRERIATETLQVEADRDHILLLSGTLAAPTVTVWTGDVRTFDSADTVLEARFANASATLGNVDVYFDAPGTAPGTNPPVATLAFGEIGAAADYEAGEYVMTVTEAGDANTVHFSSRTSDLLPQFAHVISIFDGDEGDTAPYFARSMTSVGNPLSLPDAAYPPQIRFIHGASTLQAVDIYEDEMLTQLVYSGLDFKGVTTYLDTVSEAKTYYFTPAGSTGTTLFNLPTSAPVFGTFVDVIVFGDTDDWTGARNLRIPPPSSNTATFRIFHGALNHGAYDAYVLDRDEPLTDELNANLLNANFSLYTPLITTPTGNFDLYLTVQGEKTVITGPYPLDTVVGTNVELLLVDTVDPLTAELIDITP